MENVTPEVREHVAAEYPETPLPEPKAASKESKPCSGCNKKKA